MNTSKHIEPVLPIITYDAVEKEVQRIAAIRAIKAKSGNALVPKECRITINGQLV